MSEEIAPEVPASLLKLEELRLESIQYWARIRALQDRREELKYKLSAAIRYERELVEGSGRYDDRPKGAFERHEAAITSQRNLMAAIRALMEMVDEEDRRIRILEPTAALFDRAQQHYLAATVGWVRDAV